MISRDVSVPYVIPKLDSALRGTAPPVDQEERRKFLDSEWGRWLSDLCPWTRRA